MSTGTTSPMNPVSSGARKMATRKAGTSKQRRANGSTQRLTSHNVPTISVHAPKTRPRSFTRQECKSEGCTMAVGAKAWAWLEARPPTIPYKPNVNRRKPGILTHDGLSHRRARSNVDSRGDAEGHVEGGALGAFEASPIASSFFKHAHAAKGNTKLTMATPAGASSKKTRSSTTETPKAHTTCAASAPTSRASTRAYTATSMKRPATRTNAPTKKSS